MQIRMQTAKMAATPPMAANRPPGNSRSLCAVPHSFSDSSMPDGQLDWPAKRIPVSGSLQILIKLWWAAVYDRSPTDANWVNTYRHTINCHRCMHPIRDIWIRNQPLWEVCQTPPVYRLEWGCSVPQCTELLMPSSGISRANGRRCDRFLSKWVRALNWRACIVLRGHESNV